MPLDQFAKEGAPLEVRVPWFPESLWFVPGAREVDLLTGEGIRRGCVWTAQELMDLLHTSGLTQEDVRLITIAKRAFSASVVEVRRRRPDGE